jgi:hypothetical protein
MIHKCEGGESLSAAVHEFSFMISAMNSIVKDAARIKDHVERNAT